MTRTNRVTEKVRGKKIRGKERWERERERERGKTKSRIRKIDEIWDGHNNNKGKSLSVRVSTIAMKVQSFKAAQLFRLETS